MKKLSGCTAALALLLSTSLLMAAEAAPPAAATKNKHVHARHKTEAPVKQVYEIPKSNQKLWDCIDNLQSKSVRFEEAFEVCFDITNPKNSQVAAHDAL